MHACIDEPSPESRVDPLCFLVRGWIAPTAGFEAGGAVEAWAGNERLGYTSESYERPDVTAALGLPPGTRSGFEFFAHHPATGGQPFDLEIRLRRPDGAHSTTVIVTRVTPITRDYRTNHFGVLLDQRTTAIQRRANIWAVGPSQHEGSGELAHLMRRHLGPPPLRLIDVGCGFGSYGRGLLADGYDWLGVEVNPADCAELARLGLPHHQVDGRALPFADGAFDAALCIEVLEHIDEPRAFLREVSRVAPRQIGRAHV